MKLKSEEVDKLFLLLDTLQAYLKLPSSDGPSSRQPLRAQLKIIMPVCRRMLADAEYLSKAIETLENEGGITHG